ncbi:hypothetical protein K504DRAFT_230498 [Pleomassaria siparia CBS 279.74]|uniref:Uncharacterized protein n=1 Tax=Pleomassaria siparia CBS 279.74 TaxID=1314801 RepID=A0A6G1KG90_9PLEO|nr:hypothetical protein K504DRAFT_230498 [Pleomassaria siparia CBS 279.74]
MTPAPINQCPLDRNLTPRAASLPIHIWWKLFHTHPHPIRPRLKREMERERGERRKERGREGEREREKNIEKKRERERERESTLCLQSNVQNVPNIPNVPPPSHTFQTVSKGASSASDSRACLLSANTHPTNLCINLCITFV